MSCILAVLAECIAFLLYPTLYTIHPVAVKSANLNLALTKNAHKTEHLPRTVPTKDAHRTEHLPERVPTKDAHRIVCFLVPTVLPVQVFLGGCI